MKKRFRIIGVAVAVAVVALMVFSGVALAADPTDTDWEWDGGGHFEGSVTGGNGDPACVDMSWNGGGGLLANVKAGDDAVVTFTTGGNGISGTFNCVDNNKNTWYGGGNVDNVSSYITATVSRGGFIQYQTTRTDTEIYHCHGTGQVSYSKVWSYSGTAEMATSSTSKGAGLGDNNYYFAPRTSGSHIFEASGTGTDELPGWEIIRRMTGWDGDYAGVYASGSGSAYMDYVSAGAGGRADGNAYIHNSDGAHYTHFNATGSGTFDLLGSGNQSVKFDDYWGGLNDLGDPTDVTLLQTPGPFSKLVTSGNSLTVVGNGDPASASWRILADFTSGLDVADYSLTAN